jgi:hypothetical protein
MDSVSGGSKNTMAVVRSSLSCRSEVELKDEAHSVALVLSFDDAFVKLDETLDSSSCQSH